MPPKLAARTGPPPSKRKETPTMGIDVYMMWDDMTPEEEDAQIVGFDPTKGETGYLREAYFRDQYALYDFVPEAFGCGSDGASIPAAILADRMEQAAANNAKRYSDPETAEAVTRSFFAFVQLAKRKERELGKPIRVYASY